jgi:hypothetical protein
MKVARRHAIRPELFLFKAVPPVDPLLTSTPMPHLLHEPWQCVSGTFNITTPEGR